MIRVASPRLVTLVRALTCGAALCVPLLAAGADPTKAECIASNERAQELRRAEKLTAARELLATCIATSCPATLREDCAQRLTELDAAMPAIVFEVKDAAGADLVAVRVTMDGKPLVEKLGGSAIALDPGQHDFVFQAEGKRSVEKTLLIRENEKARIEKIVMEVEPASATATQGGPTMSTSTAAETTPGSKKLSPLLFVAGGVGLAGIAGGIGLALAEGSKHSALQGECNGDVCPPSAQGDLDSFHTLRTASIVAYAVGAVGVVGAVVLYATAPTESAGGVTARVWVGPGSLAAAGTF
jgi:hypothetical protein